MKKSSNYIYLVVMVILIPIYAGAVGMIIARSLGFKLVGVASSSMEPGISKDDALIVRQEYGRYLPGQIITFKTKNSPGDLVTHRVVRVDKNYLVTKGDANSIADRPISRDQIVGAPIARLKQFGLVLNIFRRPIGLFLLVYLPSLIVILLEVHRLVENASNKRYLIDYSYAKKRQKA